MAIEGLHYYYLTSNERIVGWFIHFFIFHHRSKFLKENTALEIPYLKNAGIGLIAMGLIQFGRACFETIISSIALIDPVKEIKVATRAD